MKKPAINPATGKTNHHSAKLANRTHDLMMQEYVQTKRLNDNGDFSITRNGRESIVNVFEMRPYDKGNTLHTTNRNILHTFKQEMIPVKEGESSHSVPIIPIEKKEILSKAA